MYMAWHSPAFFKDGDADAEIAAGVLGQGRSSRLYRKLVYEKQIAQSVNAYQYSLMLGRRSASTRSRGRGTRLQELEAAIDEELALLRKEGPTAAEVERVRNVLETRMLSGLQRRGGFGGVADQLNLYNHYLGTPDYLAQDITRRRNVTPESVRRFAQQYLQPNARVVVHGVPGKQDLGPEVPKPAAQQARAAGAGSEAVNADEPWRATPPEAVEPSRAALLPTPQSFQLANGLTVLVSPQMGMPLVSASTGRAQWRRREPGRQARSRELFRRDAESGNRHAQRDAARRGSRADRRVVDAGFDDGLVDDHDVEPRAGIFLPALSTARGRRAALDVSRPKRWSGFARARLADVVQQRSNPTSSRTT